MSKPLVFAPPTYQYALALLRESQVLSDPIRQFKLWFDDARQIPKDLPIIPESVVFSTSQLPSGRVSSRVVLMKELDERGFVVYSNWDTSKKAADYKSNKFAALTFFWPHLQRQVRVEGLMEKVTRETSERYFKTRPRGSKIGAWTSPQSSTIESRLELDRLCKEYEKKFEKLQDDEIPCPPLWGGMRIVPLEIEFWQGGMSRLHDRLVFSRESIEAQWNLKRLAP